MHCAWPEYYHSLGLTRNAVMLYWHEEDFYVVMPLCSTGIVTAINTLEPIYNYGRHIQLRR